MTSTPRLSSAPSPTCWRKRFGTKCEKTDNKVPFEYKTRRGCAFTPRSAHPLRPQETSEGETCVKRILDCHGSDLAAMKGQDLKASLRPPEGRTLPSELLVRLPSPFEDVSLPEVARSFGADLLLLNLFDVNRPRISGLPVEEGEEVVRLAKRFTGRPVGVNLEPVDPDPSMMEKQIPISAGRTLNP